MNRLWIKSGGFAGNGTVSDGDHELLYDRPISHTRYSTPRAASEPMWTRIRSRVGSRGHRGPGAYFFNLEPTFYISDGGHMAGRINGSLDLFVTQRWVVQPQAELNFYSKDDPARETGSGFSESMPASDFAMRSLEKSIPILDGLTTEVW